MEYKNLVLDFIERTEKNLRFIEQAALNERNGEVYEITQLINSLLGLIVFPSENFYQSIPEKSLAELQAQGWRIPEVSGDFQQVENLRQLMRYLRNSIAHSNLEFDSNGYHLTGVRLWNCRGGIKNWEIRMSLEELRSLTQQFIQLIRQEQEKFGGDQRRNCQKMPQIDA